MKGEYDVRDLEEDHPGRQYAGILEDMLVEETLKGPIIMGSGALILIQYSEINWLISMLHSTHLSGKAMWETCRLIWNWAGPKNQCHMYAKQCQTCRIFYVSKVRQQSIIPVDVTKIKPLDLIGVDLFHFGRLDYICAADKATGFRFAEHLKRKTTEDVCSALER